jgi:hypothetical protein
VIVEIALQVREEEANIAPRTPLLSRVLCDATEAVQSTRPPSIYSGRLAPPGGAGDHERLFVSSAELRHVRINTTLTCRFLITLGRCTGPTNVLVNRIHS